MLSMVVAAVGQRAAEEQVAGLGVAVEEGCAGIAGVPSAARQALV